jgi:hypothetical protein
VRILLWMMGIAFVLMWGLGLAFHVFGTFVWFLLGWGLLSLGLGFRAPVEM